MRAVIIVDDSKPDRYLVRRMLEEIGVNENIVELRGGSELIELASDSDRLRTECGSWSAPILVLLDVNMPGMTGFEAVYALEALAASGSIDPEVFDITIFTCSDAPRDREEASRHPMIRSYVVKPDMPEALQTFLEERWSA